MHSKETKIHDLWQVLRCDAVVAKEVLHKFGTCTSPRTSARYIRQNLAIVKAKQDEALQNLPDDWILAAAVDNAGKQQGSNFVNTVQIFLWSFPRHVSPTNLPSGSETPTAPPKLTEKDEEEFSQMNPIYGDAAIAEELANIEGLVTVYNVREREIIPHAIAPSATTD